MYSSSRRLHPPQATSSPSRVSHEVPIIGGGDKSEERQHQDPAEGVSGGLWVRGGITVESADGFRYETRNRVTLCRCGASRNKPFCDGSHAEVRFTDGLGPDGGSRD